MTPSSVVSICVGVFAFGYLVGAYVTSVRHMRHRIKDTLDERIKEEIAKTDALLEKVKERV